MPSPHAELYVHLVWATRSREPLLSEHVRAQVWPALAAKCSDLGCSCRAVGGSKDHVHVLVSFPPGLPVARLVAQLKGSTSHLANHLELAPGGFYWQGSYGAFTLSRRSLPQVIEYIRHQQEHHAQGDLIGALEETGTE
ncbi:MAG: IS200/IS605 family transposase [Anaerolineae bacterium]